MSHIDLANTALSVLCAGLLIAAVHYVDSHPWRTLVFGLAGILLIAVVPLLP